jgi:hypothetical protein
LFDDAPAVVAPHATVLTAPTAAATPELRGDAVVVGLLLFSTPTTHPITPAAPTLFSQPDTFLLPGTVNCRPASCSAWTDRENSSAPHSQNSSHAGRFMSALSPNQNANLSWTSIAVVDTADARETNLLNQQQLEQSFPPRYYDENQYSFEFTDSANSSHSDSPCVDINNPNTETLAALPGYLEVGGVGHPLDESYGNVNVCWSGSDIGCLGKRSQPAGQISHTHTMNYTEDDDFVLVEQACAKRARSGSSVSTNEGMVSPLEVALEVCERFLCRHSE